LPGIRKILARLKHYSQNGFEAKLFSDFAPRSLYFEITRDRQFVLNGGFIFHVPHDGFRNGGAPTLSVCLSPEKEPGWLIQI
jgi:hypothetical protein